MRLLAMIVPDMPALGSARAVEEARMAIGEGSGTQVDVTHGSTGQLAPLVDTGAPVDGFASADSSAIQRPADDEPRLGQTRARHVSIEQVLAVAVPTSHQDTVRAFALFVSGVRGWAITREYGFLHPGEMLAPATLVATPAA
jgi:ABC-type molybdate transport system substrate-binding protein